MPALPIRWLGEGPYADSMLVCTSVQVGTGATTVADTTTTSLILPRPHGSACQLLGISMQVLVAAISASGTVLAQVFKRNNQIASPADVTLTSTKSLEADLVTVLQKSYGFALTATSNQNLTFITGDICRIDIVTTNTVGTQPTATFNAVWALIKP